MTVLDDADITQKNHPVPLPDQGNPFIVGYFFNFSQSAQQETPFGIVDHTAGNVDVRLFDCIVNVENRQAELVEPIGIQVDLDLARSAAGDIRG